MTGHYTEQSGMKRTAINPWSWSQKLGYNQAEVLEGSSRQLVCSGQTSVDSEGQPQYIDDMRRQIELALDNLESVLSAAGMGLANVTRLGVYVTDVDEALKHFDVFGRRFGAAQATPPMTLVGVDRLALAGLMFEIEATAAD